MYYSKHNFRLILSVYRPVFDSFKNRPVFYFVTQFSINFIGLPTVFDDFKNRPVFGFVTRHPTGLGRAVSSPSLSSHPAQSCPPPLLAHDPLLRRLQERLVLAPAFLPLPLGTW
jgi:hypothetical protein